MFSFRKISLCIGLVSRSGSAAAALAGVFFLVSNDLTLEPSLGPVDGGAWISRTVMGNQGFPPVAVKNGLAEGFPVFQVENHLQSLEFLPEALDALHQCGWWHADIKPENILIGPSGHATLLDLGFAESIRDTDRGDMIKGSPAYWSPESCSDDLLCSTASDVYSLGVTLYESLTGRCPFVEASASAMAAAHRDAELPDPRVLVPQLGPRVARLLRAMLAKSAADRPTARQLIDRLVDLEIDTLPERIPA